MKVGKKALSLLLAVIMLMSSVSVSFSVFAAEGDIDYAYSILSTYFKELMVAIDRSEGAIAKAGGADKADYSDPAFDSVPVKDGSKWVIR